MKTRNPLSLSVVLLKKTSLALLLLGLASCGAEKKKEMTPEPEADPAIVIRTELMDFQLKDSIRSGWQTFRYTNNSQEPHFFLLEKYPEGKTIDDARQEVVPVFQEGMDYINEGNMDEAMQAFGNLPEWFQQIIFTGGSGLISPGETAVTTLDLEPGYYLMECYVKMENGMFHTSMGMLEDLVVMTDSVDYHPPAATISVTISREEGIVMDGTPKEGLQVFKVFYKEQSPHEHFVGHDVNLVRLSESSNLDSLARWMNWSDPKGLISPAPPGITFLGGVNEMPAGHTGYFTVALTPGNYALISEVPNPAEKNMLQTFEVTSNKTAP